MASETLAAMAGAILPPPNAAALLLETGRAPPDAAGAAPAGEVSSGFFGQEGGARVAGRGHPLGQDGAQLAQIGRQALDLKLIHARRVLSSAEFQAMVELELARSAW